MNIKLEKLKIRQASIDDLFFVLEVQKAAMSPATIRVYGSWNNDLQKKSTNEETISTYEVISFSGRDIGALQIFKTKTAFEFNRLYILPKEQSKGYGSSIMKVILERALKAEKKEIHFKVYKTNERAIDLYKKNGCYIAEELDLHFKMSYRV